jgi:hypothetical protein
MCLSASEVGTLAESDKTQSFWTTLPGLLTGLAALLTAVTGFLVIVHPHGAAGPKESPPAVARLAPETAREAPDAPGSSSHASATMEKKKTTVLVTAKDGTATRVFLNGFKNSYTDEAIDLKSGQSIPFDKIRSISFLEQHDYLRDLTVTLTDGRVLEGSIASGQQFLGETDIGPFSISVANSRQILFER